MIHYAVRREKMYSRWLYMFFPNIFCRIYLWSKESLSIHPRHIRRTVHPIFFTIGRCVVEDERQCTVQLGAIWTFDTFSINTAQINSRRRPQTLRYSVHPETVKELGYCWVRQELFLFCGNQVNRHFFGYCHVVCLSFQPDPFSVVLGDVSLTDSSIVNMIILSGKQISFQSCGFFEYSSN